MTYLLYNIIFTCFLVFAAPYFLVRALIDGRFRRALIQRMGFLPSPSMKGPIWVHAASVGEVFCTIPLLKRIKKEFTHCEIVLTTMTSTGNEAAKSRVPEANRVFFFPFDHPLMLQRAMEKIQPSLVLIAETELWPNFLHACGKKRVPVVLFNGRISEKSYRRYRLLKSFFKKCLQSISLFLMQAEGDRLRIVQIGATPERTRVTGNLKFDQSFSPVAQEALTRMSESFRLGEREAILIAGSTRPGEEEILLNLFRDLRESIPHLVLILAPRHLERLDEVERILKREFLPWIRRTSLQDDRKGRDRPPVILLDTMGELMGLYSLGTVVFIGGSLVPLGGHNPLEPLFFKKCTLFGPYMFHFSEISSRLVEAGGAIQVENGEALAVQLKRLLLDEEARNQVGEKGYQFLQRHQGATEKTFEEIKPFLAELRISDCGMRNRKA